MGLDRPGRRVQLLCLFRAVGLERGGYDEGQQETRLQLCTLLDSRVYIHEFMISAVEQRYLSVEDTARYLGLSVKTIYSWAEKGAMPAYKVGRVWRFDKTELDGFVKGQPSEPLYNPHRSGPERKGV
jgi:excisionase family DNA binding protein